MRGLAIRSFGWLMAGVLLASLPLGVSAQEKKAAAQAAPSAAAPAVTPAASPKDVQSLDAMVAAIYDVISGPPGSTRVEPVPVALCDGCAADCSARPEGRQTDPGGDDAQGLRRPRGKIFSGARLFRA